MIWTWLADTVLKPVTEVVGQWQKRKTAKAKHEIDIAEAKTKSVIRRLDKDQDAEIASDTINSRNAASSWKDEYLLIVFSIPLVMSFVPELVVYVERGFEALDKTPDWYQYAIGVMVSTSFGYRKFADWMGRRYKK